MNNGNILEYQWSNNDIKVVSVPLVTIKYGRYFVYYIFSAYFELFLRGTSAVFIFKLFFYILKICDLLMKKKYFSPKRNPNRKNFEIGNPPFLLASPCPIIVTQWLSRLILSWRKPNVYGWWVNKIRVTTQGVTKRQFL